MNHGDQEACRLAAADGKDPYGRRAIRAALQSCVYLRRVEESRVEDAAGEKVLSGI